MEFSVQMFTITVNIYLKQSVIDKHFYFSVNAREK